MDNQVKKKEYYIRTEGFNGDSLLWWRPNEGGYTMDLNKAGRYSEDDALSICRGSGTEAAYECNKVDNLKEGIFRVAHADYLGYKQADITFRGK